MGCATPRHTVLPSCMQATPPTYPSFSLAHPSPHRLTPSQRNQGESYPRSSLYPSLVKPVPTCLFSPICLLSLPFDQPRSDWTLHVTDLVPSLKNHTLSSTLTHDSISPSLCSKPQATPLPSGLLSPISLFLFNPNQTPHLFLCLIFILFDL